MEDQRDLLFKRSLRAAMACATVSIGCGVGIAMVPSGLEGTVAITAMVMMVCFFLIILLDLAYSETTGEYVYIDFPL